MSDEDARKLPDHLTALLQPTPSGTAKLIAAWDGLTPETQILILTEKEKSPCPPYLNNRFIATALKSENAYVRYQPSKKSIKCMSERIHVLTSVSRQT